MVFTILFFEYKKVWFLCRRCRGENEFYEPFKVSSLLKCALFDCLFSNMLSYYFLLLKVFILMNYNISSFLRAGANVLICRMIIACQIFLLK